jgi:glycosyltransferase involved in cell wall biosynthesis
VKRRARLAFHAAAALPTFAAYVLVVVPLARIRAARKRRRGERPAILWGPIPIANLRNSVAADRLYGYPSETLVYRPYSAADRKAFDRVWEPFGRVRGLRQLGPYLAFLWAGLRYDIFCFYFDGGLIYETPFWRAELPLLRLAGKKIVVWPYGGDARLPSVARAEDRWNAYTDVPPGAEDHDEADRRARIAAFGRWAHVVMGCNDLVAHLPRVQGVLRYPYDTNGKQPVEAPDDGVVTVVHASNHRHYKGTRFVVDAVERLREEGLPVELVLVEGVPNHEALRIYENADVIASDFLIGGYALFAIEGMALGKPVLCYLPERLWDFHPEWTEAPIVNASPETLVDELRRLVVDPELRRELGARGPGYVERWHSPASVGADLDGIYRRLWPVRG